jgi:hypothetical protein
VDAICINQDDKVEKSQQLLWMGSIYRRAKEVVAWLGAEDVISAMVMDYIPPLRHSRTVTGPGSNLEIADFISFLERPYWSRVWIIQELALAKHTTIHCGGRQMSWAQFLSAVRSQERDAQQSASRSLKHPAFVNAKNLIKFQQDSSKVKPVRFIEALERSSESKSTDPRDKAFALLQLVYDGALYIPVPNYRQSVEDICIAITLSVVSTTSNLDIIPLLGCGCDNQDILPSWCPPWLNLFDNDRSRSLRYMEDGYIDYSLEPPHRSPFKSKLKYNAAGNTTIMISMQDRVLKTQGFLVDRVDSLLLPEGSKSATRYENWFQSVGDCPNFTAHGYGDARGLFRAICETLTRHDTNDHSWRIDDVLFILCSTVNSSRSRNRTTSEVYNLLSIIASLDVVWNTFKNTARSIPTSHCEWVDSQEESPTCPSHHREPAADRIERVLRDGQTFMITLKGYVGWAHPLALPGDHIYILSGCKSVRHCSPYT